jgi:hypothetical protein
LSVDNLTKSSVKGFLDKIQNGVRPNLFEVDFLFPKSEIGDQQDEVLSGLLCKSAALPASNLGVIEVPFRGRTVKIAGDRTFDTWTATFINDSDFRIRRAMENWMEEINRHEQNTATLVSPTGSDKYLADIVVKQLKRDSSPEGEIVTGYKLWGCFPTNISQIDLAYDSNDQIEDFTVEFQIQYWTRGDAGSYDNVVAGQSGS